MQGARKVTRTIAWAAIAVIAIALSGVSAMAQGASAVLPDSENGRFVFSPGTNSVLRLDTRSGAVSSCTDKAGGWACFAVPDERAALDTEIGRLQADNKRLKDDLAKTVPTVSGKIDAPLPKEDSKKSAARPKIEFELPNDRDLDRVVSFLERAWRRLIAMAERVQRDATGKI